VVNHQPRHSLSGMEVPNVAERMCWALTNAIQASLTDVFGRMCLEPGMRSVPQSRLSRDMVTISSCISALRRGRPPGWRDVQRQNRHQPCRCQRTTVSGVTNTRWVRHAAQKRRARIHRSLSQVRSRRRGRVRVGRVSTASWWRRRRFSTTRSWRGRTRPRTARSRRTSSSSTLVASPIWVRPRYCRPTITLVDVHQHGTISPPASITGSPSSRAVARTRRRRICHSVSPRRAVSSWTDGRSSVSSP